MLARLGLDVSADEDESLGLEFVNTKFNEIASKVCKMMIQYVCVCVCVCVLLSFHTLTNLLTNTHTYVDPRPHAHDAVLHALPHGGAAVNPSRSA